MFDHIIYYLMISCLFQGERGIFCKSCEGFSVQLTLTDMPLSRKLTHPESPDKEHLCQAGVTVFS